MNRALSLIPLRNALVVASIAGSALGAAPASRAADIQGNARILVQLDEAWSAAAATKDADKVASFYADDAVAYPPNEPVAMGRAAAGQVWAAYFAVPDFAISWKSTHAEISQSGELGYTSGTYEDSYTGADGRKVHEAGKFLCVWRKQADGSWKAVHDMWNADAN